MIQFGEYRNVGIKDASGKIVIQLLIKKADLFMISENNHSLKTDQKILNNNSEEKAENLDDQLAAFSMPQELTNPVNDTTIKESETHFSESSESEESNDS